MNNRAERLEREAGNVTEIYSGKAVSPSQDTESNGQRGKLGVPEKAQWANTNPPSIYLPALKGILMKEKFTQERGKLLILTGCLEC